MDKTIGVHTTITNPHKQGYAWKEAIENYLSFADQVVVVDGGSEPEVIDWLRTKKVKIINLEWPQGDWHWSELPRHNQAGYEALETNWAIRMDIDYLLHENDFKRLREGLGRLSKENYLLASFMKKIILNKTTYYKKCPLPILINKERAKNTMAYGYDKDTKSDWCFPIYIEGKDERGVYYGRTPNKEIIQKTDVSCWVYDYFFRDEKMVAERFWKFSQAWHKISGKWDWGDNEENAFKTFCRQQYGRLRKNVHFMTIDEHPKAIKERIKNMLPEEWGYDNWDDKYEIYLSR